MAQFALGLNALVEFVQGRRQFFFKSGLQRDEVLSRCVVQADKAQALDNFGQIVQGGCPFRRSPFFRRRAYKGLSIEQHLHCAGITGDAACTLAAAPGRQKDARVGPGEL
ncbi:hypothetical protein [Methylocystis echinoides]|uniref:hypothetical protein n=1 Tax=Methylocystis echinoides TaxID=29468 RepID=UPI00248FC17E|nr:hypothetical protein [Methylocystis echinoides]